MAIMQELDNKSVIETLETFIKMIKDKKVELTEFYLTDKEYMQVGLDWNDTIQNQTLTIDFNRVPKKVYKKPHEIYDDLYEEKLEWYEDTHHRLQGDEDKVRRICNKYAIENTRQRWREQYNN